MNKIKLIIIREYLTRVKKKSFVIMTLLGPMLMAGLMIVPIWLATKDKDIQLIEVIDETNMFGGQFENTKDLKFEYYATNIEKAKSEFYNTKYTSILHITSTEKTSQVKMYYKKQPGISTVQKIKHTIETGIRNIDLENKYKITKNQIEASEPTVKIESISLDIEGEEESKDVGISTALGLGGAIMIYFFIFMYGIQIMRGVIEEKTSRIVEIIISSVKPFQLMLGKIIGIALVGLTQFISWMVLTSILYSVIAGLFLGGDVEALTQSQQALDDPNVQEALKSIGGAESLSPKAMLDSIMSEIPIIKLLLSFLFYFLGGYLLYGALLAAIGSAVDSEADSQQFMMPITIPLIFSFVVAQVVMENPDGPMAFWLSMFPLTSPIIMMVRIPFGVEIWELLLSMTLLIAGFIGATWMAGKIYRTGILMYGKKITYKELWKWLFYKG
ncbi:MAG: ABC transporter permease [Vicingaceae bacterium]